MWELCENARFSQSFWPIATLCVTAKFPHQKIRRDFGILRSGSPIYYVNFFSASFKIPNDFLINIALSFHFLVSLVDVAVLINQFSLFIKCIKVFYNCFPVLIIMLFIHEQEYDLQSNSLVRKK